MTWQIANSQITPASRQPYMLLSKRPTLLLSVSASSGSSTNRFLRARQQKCASPCNHLSNSLGSSSIVAQIHKLRRASSGGVAAICLTFVFLHDQSTTAEPFVFVTFVDVNPARTKHDLVTESVYHLPDTKFTDDRNFICSCLLDMCVVPLVSSM